MNSPLASDLSLYELALNADNAPPALQISPATLKSVVGALIDLLVDYQIPAIVWAKLPRGEVWQSELDRYSSLSRLPQGVFSFRNQRDDGADDAGMSSTTIALGNDLVSDKELIDGSSEATVRPDVSLQLVPESQLRREYFLIVWSAQIQGVILAHRPRSAQISRPLANQELRSGAISESEAAEGGQTEDNQDKRQHLLALSSFDAGLVEQVLQGLERAKTVDSLRSDEVSSTATALSTPQSSPLESAVAQWKQLIATIPAEPANPTVLGHLMTKQLQRQEEIWQRSATYRKQAETAEVLQIQNEELTSTLRVKDDFLNNVGQELRTPLTTIKTALTLLNSPNLKPPQRQRYMELITKECDRQSSLITSLLDLVQLERVADQTVLQPLRVAEIVPGVVSTYQPLAEEKGVMLAYTIPEDLPAVSCANNWLKQIVINLLHNGIKFTPRGGQVWVRAKQLGNFVQLEFRDTGVGIAAGEIPKIFDRFYRVRQAPEETSGAGLGLTIVQQLLIHCGGSISVKSKLGEGSTFNVLLPVHIAPDQLHEI